MDVDFGEKSFSIDTELQCGHVDVATKQRYELIQCNRVLAKGACQMAGQRLGPGGSATRDVQTQPVKRKVAQALLQQTDYIADTSDRLIERVHEHDELATVFTPFFERSGTENVPREFGGVAVLCKIEPCDSTSPFALHTAVQLFECTRLADACFPKKHGAPML